MHSPRFSCLSLKSCTRQYAQSYSPHHASQHHVVASAGVLQTTAAANLPVPVLLLNMASPKQVWRRTATPAVKQLCHHAVLWRERDGGRSGPGAAGGARCNHGHGTRRTGSGLQGGLLLPCCRVQYVYYQALQMPAAASLCGCLLYSACDGLQLTHDAAATSCMCVQCCLSSAPTCCGDDRPWWRCRIRSCWRSCSWRLSRRAPRGGQSMPATPKVCSAAVSHRICTNPATNDSTKVMLS